jgi:DNA-binding NtrC family response regulator
MKDWKVLLVDDEADFVDTLRERLSIRGVSCRMALDAKSGLAALKESPADVVVLDMFMPGMSGLEMLARIREDHPGAQVILLSGQGDSRDGREGMKLGAFDYMVKPLSLDELIGKIAEAVAISRGAPGKP